MRRTQDGWRGASVSPSGIGFKDQPIAAGALIDGSAALQKLRNVSSNLVTTPVTLS